jgi:NAD(P)-dependent dehydrogenase (short-subunit alcohol dehydrogenase family)
VDYRGFDTDFNLSGSTALVTGAAQGIGREIAALFARKHASVILVDRKPEVKEVARELSAVPAKTFALIGDLTVTSDIDRIVRESVEFAGRLDILVNNAGIALLAEAQSISEDWWDRTIDVNLTAPFMLAQRVGRVMIRQGRGKIINIASQASIVGLENHVAYCASKAGMVGMARVLALEWGKFNITVNCISPTVIMTELGKAAWQGDVGQAMVRRIPVGRFGRPEEVAAAALYLASEAADMVTGSNLVIDGGFTAQ